VLYGNGTWATLPSQVFTTSGSNAYFIGGKLGVGRDNPQYVLDVLGTSRIGKTILTDSLLGNAKISGNTSIRGNASISGNTAITGSISVSSLGGNSGGSFVYADSLGNIVARPFNPGTNILLCTPQSPWMIGGNKLGSVVNAVIGTCDNHDFVMETNSAEKMRITTTGNVGIGTNSPTGLFHINNSSTSLSPLVITGVPTFGTGDTRLFEVKPDGSVYSREIFVQVTDFPDYVFKKGYKLMPLDEVEKYYKANQHLPEVPSEKEIVENGLNIGDMNKVLLKKIEELTLYTVDLEKKLKALEEKINK
jgi:hypothetical protein